MSDSLPSPPTSREATPERTSGTTDTAELASRLDSLLEEYLESLDRYTKLRHQLSVKFSEAFLSLARAQHTSNLGPGRRYGQDGYDDRMKAAKRVVIEQKNDRSSQTSHTDNFQNQDLPEDVKNDVSQPVVNIVHYENKKAAVHPGSDPRSTNEGSDAPQFAIIEERNTNSEKNVSEPVSTKSADSKAGQIYRDPLTWYGILVPQNLRQAKTSFSNALESTVGEAVNAIRTLEYLEYQIWRVRNQLGKAHGEDDEPQTLPLRPV